MLNCMIHGAQDLRLDEQDPQPLGPSQVRVGIKAERPFHSNYTGILCPLGQNW